MNYSEVLQAMKSASAFDLFRLSCAIYRELERPEHIVAIKRLLKIGQTIRYFDSHENREYEARITKFGRTRLHVQNIEDGKRWNIFYYTVNLDNADVSVSQQSNDKPITPNDLHVGQRIGFYDRDNQERSGIIERINPKTVSIQTDTGRWRVAYCYLFQVIDGSSEGDIIGQAALLPADD